LTTKQVKNVEEEARSRTAEKNGSGYFKDLLDTHTPKPIRRGQIVEGEIIKLQENLAIVDVGAKRDAIVPPEEMGDLDDEFLGNLDEGDNVFVYVMRTPVGGEELLVSLEKGLREQDWQRAARYMDSQEVLELKIVGENSGGLLVEFGRLQGFIPNSHVPRLATIFDRQKRSETKSEMINSTVSVKVLEIERQRKRLILSARNARAEVRKERFQELKQLEGEVITAPVANLVDFGAFIDLDGVEGLLHISEITWRKINDPAECLSPGEQIEVLIQSVDVERERVSLSRKALLPDPWELFASTHDEGELVEGVVINVVDFGAFVRVTDGIEGLVHTSEISGAQDLVPEDILSPGDEVLVRILQIQPERQRLALSQRRVTRDEQLAWIWERQGDSEGAEEEE